MAESSSDAATTATGANDAASAPDEPPLPPKLRPKPQRKGNVGAGKLYADEAAFAADVATWEREWEERKVLVKERERWQDRQRDRSGRKRDGEHETDSERRVRQRQESQVAIQAHADHQAAQRRSSRLERQQAWAQDVAAFAAIFESDEPRRHQLAYTAHWDGRLGDWLKEGELICGLHDFIASHPPTGEEGWEIDVDNRAVQLWRPGELERGEVPNGFLWHSLGVGYARLLSLASAPKLLAAELKPPMAKYAESIKTNPKAMSENEARAKRGLAPVPGWEPLVTAGYMAPPAFYTLPEDEVRRRRARAALEEAFRAGRPGPFDHFGDRSSKFWKDASAPDVCKCNWQLCRCPIGLVLGDAELEPVMPLRAARVEDC